MPADKLKNLLNPSGNGELSDIVQRAQAMAALADRLSALLPDGLGAGIRAANVRADGELVVVADSPAWAARLRFEGDKLLAAARATDEQVTSVSVRVSHDV